MDSRPNRRNKASFSAMSLRSAAEKTFKFLSAERQQHMKGRTRPVVCLLGTRKEKANIQAIKQWRRKKNELQNCKLRD